MSTAKVIAKEGLYVRADRNRKSEPVRTMAYGEEFEFIEEYKGWLAVEDGWVMLSDAWVKPVEMSGSAELPFGEEVVTETEVLFSQTVTDVVITETSKGISGIAYDGDIPSYSDLPEGAYVTVEYKSPTINRVITLDEFASYYGTMKVTNPKYLFYVTWTKSNGAYTISVIDLYRDFGEDSDITLTVTLQVDHEIHNITTIDSKFLPETHQFGEKTTETVVYPENTARFNADGIYISIGRYILQDCSNGDTVKIVIDGDEYVTTLYNESYYLYFGDSSFDNEPFYYDSNAGTFSLDTSVYGGGTSMDHTIAIYKLETTVTTIDPKFLPTVVLDFGDGLNPTCNKTFAEMCQYLIDRIPVYAVKYDSYGPHVINEYCALSNSGAPLTGLNSAENVAAISFVEYTQTESILRWFLLPDNTLTGVEPTWSGGGK